MSLHLPDRSLTGEWNMKKQTRGFWSWLLGGGWGHGAAG
jgi:hypothetical protein